MTPKKGIIDLIKIENDPSITRDELAKKLSKSKATITRAIKSSLDIKFVGPSKIDNFYY